MSTLMADQESSSMSGSADSENSFQNSVLKLEFKLEFLNENCFVFFGI
jgi:hypothetical protein